MGTQKREKEIDFLFFNFFGKRTNSAFESIKFNSFAIISLKNYTLAGYEPGSSDLEAYFALRRQG
jgi:hypothetical protein